MLVIGPRATREGQLAEVEVAAGSFVVELPPGWRITRDAKTRIVYFYNESTRETRQFRDPPPDSQEAYKLLVAGLPPPPPGAPVPFRRGSSSIIALSYAMRFVHKLKNMGKAGRESSGYI